MQSPAFLAEDGKTDRTYRFAICAGSLISDAKVEMFNKKKTSFVIKYHGRNYMTCVLWGDSQSANIAASLEKGDMVLAIGTVTTSKYTVRKGEHKGQEKEWHDLNCQILIPMSVIEFALQLYSLQGVQKLLANAEASIEADVFESANDFDDEIEEAKETETEYDYGFMEGVEDEDIPFLNF